MSDAPKPDSKPTEPNAADALQPPEDSHDINPSAERDLWHGRQSWKTMYPMLGLWLLALIGVVVLIIVYPNLRSWWWFAGLGVLLLVLVARTGWRVVSTSYRITTQRMFIRRGVFSQSVDQTELLRVDDVTMRQSLLQRVLGIGNVKVSSSDRSDANVELVSIAEPAKVVEFIRRHTRLVQGKRTLFMEQL